VADPKHPLLLLPTAQEAAKARRSGGASDLRLPSRRRQGERLQPQFAGLETAFQDRSVRLQDALHGIALEQVVVFEVAGSVANFYRAVRNAGLQWLFEVDGADAAPDEDFRLAKNAADPLPTKLFLILSNQQALQDILGLWRGYQRVGREAFQRGLAPWFHVFQQLRAIRLWDITDRVEPDTRSAWQERLDAGDAVIRTEIELWYSDSDHHNAQWVADLRALLHGSGSAVIATAQIAAIRYHAVLADLSAQAVRAILDDPASPLAVTGPVMYYRPQVRAMAPAAPRESTAFTVGRPIPTGDPIVAILDGVPLQNHALLAERIILDDPDGLQAQVPAQDRVHGTSMASIVLHGDLNGQTPTVANRVLLHPILVPDSQGREISSPDRLLLDVIHIAVRRLVDTFPSVRVINLSIGDVKREFVRSMSPLARLHR
jgi:hypothetical protein